MTSYLTNNSEKLEKELLRVIFRLFNQRSELIQNLKKL